MGTKEACPKSVRAGEATEITKRTNSSVSADPNLRWDDQEDFRNAGNGFIAKDNPLTIKGRAGETAFDMEGFARCLNSDSAVPETVNPSLWRHAQLNTSAGIFKVCDHLYQVRGYDISNMTIVEGKTGYLVLDTLMKVETSKAAMDLAFRTLGEKPVKAIILGHSHGDHFGGISGVFEASKAGKEDVQVIAPIGFESAAIRENILAGPAMVRRSIYQFGYTLPVGPTGVVDSGLGKRGPGGTMSFVSPTDHILRTGETRSIDGIDLFFQMAPESEAPATMHIFLPQLKALWFGEVVNHTNHNLCPMRGAPTRDAKKWAEYIDEMIESFQEAEIALGSHFWPVWGKEKVRNLLVKQRDLYKFMHDQTLRLANHGYTGTEIADMLTLPHSLASEWFNRDYYGALKFNLRSIYTRYFGWYDGNPANLDPLPPEETSKRLVRAMGGAASVVTEAENAFASGDYRWVVQLLNYVVFADPGNMSVRNLLADAYEQLGFQQESATYRNAYLTGAQELRGGEVPKPPKKTLSMYAQMNEEDLFDGLAVRLNGPRAEGKTMSINWWFLDRNSRYLTEIYNSVLHYARGKKLLAADASVVLNSVDFIRIMFLGARLDELVKSGEIQFAGDRSRFDEFLALFDVFEGNFGIVLP